MESLEAVTADRDSAVTKIAQSVADLAEIFKDLSTLVVEQVGFFGSHETQIVSFLLILFASKGIND